MSKIDRRQFIALMSAAFGSVMVKAGPLTSGIPMGDAADAIQSLETAAAISAKIKSQFDLVQTWVGVSRLMKFTKQAGQGSFQERRDFFSATDDIKKTIKRYKLNKARYVSPDQSLTESLFLDGQQDNAGMPYRMYLLTAPSQELAEQAAQSFKKILPVSYGVWSMDDCMDYGRSMPIVCVYEPLHETLLLNDDAGQAIERQNKEKVESMMRQWKDVTSTMTIEEMKAFGKDIFQGATLVLKDPEGKEHHSSLELTF